MAERGIDIAGNTTKHLRRYARSHFDQVITLCDKVREVCPEFPGHPSTAHWSIADPAAEGDTDEATYPAFERTADELEARVDQLIAELSPTQGGPAMPDDATVNVRYLVDDVAAAVDFYTRHFGFTVLNAFPRVRRRPARQPAPAAQRAAELGRPGRWPTAPNPGPADGTGSTSSSTTSSARSPGLQRRRRAVPQRGRHRSRRLAGPRSWTPPATSSSCSNRPPA